MLVVSCQKDISIDYGEFKSKLVVHSTFSPDSIFKVHISKTGNLADDNNNIESVNYATVYLRSDDPLDSIMTMYHDKDGFYLAYDFYPSQGTTYFLEANADGFNTVYANNRIPDQVSILNFDTTIVVNDQGQAIQFDFTIDNTQDNSSDFLIYDVINTNRSIKGNDAFSPEGWIESTWLYANNSDTELVNETGELQSKIFQENGGQNLGELNSSFLSYEDFSSDNGANIDTSRSIVMLRVMSVSEELYNYSKSLEFYRLSGNINSNQASPLRVYSNIVGGYGIFGGFSQTLEKL